MYQFVNELIAVWFNNKCDEGEFWAGGGSKLCLLMMIAPDGARPALTVKPWFKMMPTEDGSVCNLIAFCVGSLL